MKKYEGKSIRKVTTDTGKIPDNVGFPRVMSGVTRKLTAKEKRQQQRLSK